MLDEREVLDRAEPGAPTPGARRRNRRSAPFADAECAQPMTHHVVMYASLTEETADRAIEEQIAHHRGSESTSSGSSTHMTGQRTCCSGSKGEVSASVRMRRCSCASAERCTRA